MMIGSRIVSIRRMTEKEANKEGWDITFKTAPVIVLDDGTKIFPSRDPEGNDVGVLFGVDKKGKRFIIDTPPQMSKKSLKKVM
jgi:hypothetical protein